MHDVRDAHDSVVGDSEGGTGACEEHLTQVIEDGLADLLVRHHTAGRCERGLANATEERVACHDWSLRPGPAQDFSLRL